MGFDGDKFKQKTVAAQTFSHKLHKKLQLSAFHGACVDASASEVRINQRLSDALAWIWFGHRAVDFWIWGEVVIFAIDNAAPGGSGDGGLEFLSPYEAYIITL